MYFKTDSVHNILYIKIIAKGMKMSSLADIWNETIRGVMKWQRKSWIAFHTINLILIMQHTHKWLLIAMVMMMIMTMTEKIAFNCPDGWWNTIDHFYWSNQDIISLFLLLCKYNAIWFRISFDPNRLYICIIYKIIHFNFKIVIDV